MMTAVTVTRVDTPASRVRGLGVTALPAFKGPVDSGVGCGCVPAVRPFGRAFKSGLGSGVALGIA